MSLADEFLNRLADLAEELGLDDDDRDSFIEQGMEKKGFKKTFTWSDPEPETDNGKKVSSMFGGNREQGKERRVGNDRNWNYRNN